MTTRALGSPASFGTEEYDVAGKNVPILTVMLVDQVRSGKKQQDKFPDL